jgi:stage II sporulation protein D
MRFLSVSVLALVLVAAAAATGPPLPSPAWPAQPAVPLSAPVYVVSGGGYGHGVGLNQYGALAQAQANRSFTDILSFYYPGTTVGKAPVTKLRVLVADARPSVVISSTVPFSVRDGAGMVMPLPAGKLVLTPDLTVVVGGVAQTLPGPLAFIAGKGGPLLLDGKGYRGELRAAVVQATPKPNTPTTPKPTLQVIDVVSLEAYLLGVVPGEMPKEWPAAALQAQAVAARSYALASVVKNKPFDLYPDQRSQMYYGVAWESPSTTAAVKATKGEILTYGGKVATTYYYSSSGGRTASSQDVFGVITPYLQSRADPWDTLSPFHRWPPRTFTPASLGKAFGLPAPVADVEVVPTPSGRPASVTLVERSGARVALRAADVRAKLGLRSTAFRIGVLRVAPPPAQTAAGAQVVVSGLARDVQAPLLEKLGANGAWLPSVKVAPAVDGTFAVTVQPQTTATYRLSADGQPGPAVTITVVA